MASRSTARYELLVARLVEVLEVESVIPDLVDGICWILVFTDLKLKDENSGTGEQDDIDPPSHSRNRVLKVDCAIVLAKERLKNSNLVEPCAFLRLLVRKFAVAGQFAENGIRVGIAEGGNGRGVIGSAHGDNALCGE